MSRELDKYLKEGGFSQKDKDAFQVEEAKDANKQSLESDYQQREGQGKHLDANVSGYDKPTESKPLGDDVKAQADSVRKDWAAEYDNTKDKGQEQQPQQEQEQDIDRWEDDGGR